MVDELHKQFAMQHITVVQHSLVGVPEFNLYLTFDLVVMSNKNWSQMRSFAVIL